MTKSSEFLPKSVKKMFPGVKTVSDAEKPLQITVLAKDVTLSNKKDPKNCAMARACRRQENVDGVIVRMHHAYVIDGTHAIRYRVPPSVQREIVSFDRHKDFRLGIYQLSTPVPSDALGTKHKRKTGPKKIKSKNKIHILRHVTIGVR